ncbi:MAG: hypothetical protein HY821_17200 [Acidobacteria bacterium]|nr:hypothetical protein [Acidobacteriota bacterium]
MNPVPIELPLRPSEASQVAGLIYEQVEGRHLTDDARNRLTGRVQGLGLTSLRPHFGSLEADPVHSSAYYLAVDGLAGGEPQPLLLHIAPASAPVTALFVKPMLIGRIRPGGGREAVVNAVPFGPEDTGAIETYASSLGKVFLPRAHGLRPSVRALLSTPALSGQAAFRTFHTAFKSTGRNLAALGTAQDPTLFWQAVWAAIRAGYRDGYTLGGALTPETARRFSLFTVRPEQAAAAVQQLRTLRQGEAYDLEIDLTHATSDELAPLLERLKMEGVSPQTVLLSHTCDLQQACSAVNAAGALPAFSPPHPAGELLSRLRDAASARLALILPVSGETAAPLADAIDALR